MISFIVSLLAGLVGLAICVNNIHDPYYAFIAGWILCGFAALAVDVLKALRHARWGGGE